MTIDVSRSAAQAIVTGHLDAANAINGVAEAIPLSVDAGRASGIVADAMGTVIEQLGALADAHGAAGTIVVAAYNQLLRTEEAVADEFLDLADDVRRDNLGNLGDFAKGKP
ncbi:hypothetical protein [Nocardioides sp.]|uniref:hypothetical protein n=1 Tax=Nocardioides sp. TaxID=35761 RepID=UPI0027244D71|nr:hypothetical protein [Nocardioides sp.]MDO9455156.1 hypothetical protein [Nocardioides sp.]